MIEIIKRTGVFLIVAETLYQFIQENRYARYVRMLIRIMTLALLVLPLLDLVKEGSSEFFARKVEELEEAYTEYTYESANMGYEEELESVLTAYDNREVEEYTTAYIKDTCNKCVIENGYLIREVLIGEEGICFYLQLLESSADDNGTTIQSINTIIVPVEEVHITEIEQYEQVDVAEADWHMEEQRMQGILADFMGISGQMIEVIING